MRIAVVGKGRVGGGLADRWEKAGHDVARIGRDGGDVSDADAVLFAVPGGSIAEAVENVSGLDQRRPSTPPTWSASSRLTATGQTPSS
jgi:8-hydroxy-5-deazaflavin:NADPH oxidoreductase